MVTQALTQPAQPEAAQKIKCNCRSHQGQNLYIEYNGLQEAFRIRSGAAQRLFFFESESFQKTLFRNEYGVVLGQLVATKNNNGWVRLDGKRHRFRVDGAAGTLALYQSRAGTPALSCTLPSELPAQQLNPQHALYFVQCLVFAFAWTL